MSPLVINAQSTGSVASQIAELQRQIAVLQERLRQLQGQSGVWCHTFDKNLGVGAVDASNYNEITELQEILTREGFAVTESGASRSYYGESTAAAVSAFQLKYKNEILMPLGLSSPTGYVGPATRKVLNRLYGCGNSPVTGNRPPVISGVSGPTVLNVNQNGTWTVQASDPENGALNYSVIWGDETWMAIDGATIPPSSPVQQTATFTHSYAHAGNYYPTFTVHDNSNQSSQTRISVIVGQNSNQGITILTPNGGEIWPIGSMQIFRWNTPSVPSNSSAYRIVFTAIEGPTPFTIGATYAKDQYNSFTIPDYGSLTDAPQKIMPGKYRIKATLFNGAVCLGMPSCGPNIPAPRLIAEDISDGYITILPKQSNITVLTPNGGEQWVANSTKTISWRYNGATSATKVDLYLNDVCPPSLICTAEARTPIVLDKNIPALSTYNWIVATDVVNNPIRPGTTYAIKVCEAGYVNNTHCDSSDNHFTIVGGTTDTCINSVLGSLPASSIARGSIIVSFGTESALSLGQAQAIISSYGLTSIFRGSDWSAHKWLLVYVPNGEEAKWACILKGAVGVQSTELNGIMNANP